MTIKRSHDGITLIEVLIVVAVVSLLIALTIPAVVSAREAARRSQCASNLKQIGLALTGYNDVQGCLPVGRIKSYDIRYAGSNPPCTAEIIDKGYLIAILPFLEEQVVYNAINNSVTVLGSENSTIHTVVISIFACPTDYDSGRVRDLPQNSLARFGITNPRMVFGSYAGIAGSLLTNALPIMQNGCIVSGNNVSQNNGLMNDVAPMRLSAIADGLSATILVAERSNASLRDLDAFDPAASVLHGWYITGNWGDTIVTTLYPPNAFKNVSAIASEAIEFSASSLHPNGLNVLMADGSVHFTKETVQSWEYEQTTGLPVGIQRDLDGSWSHVPSAGVWQALSTRAGGEIVDQNNW